MRGCFLVRLLPPSLDSVVGITWLLERRVSGEGFIDFVVVVVVGGGAGAGVDAGVLAD